MGQQGCSDLIRHRYHCRPSGLSDVQHLWDRLVEAEQCWRSAVQGSCPWHQSHLGFGSREPDLLDLLPVGCRLHVTLLVPNVDFVVATSSAGPEMVLGEGAVLCWRRGLHRQHRYSAQPEVLRR